MLVNGRYEELGQIAGELVGCLVTSKKIYLFKSIMGNSSTIFFRRSGDTVRWSTNPADLVQDPDAEIDRAAVWRYRSGWGPFIYRSMDRVRPGQVVILEQHRTTAVEYDRITPMALPRRTMPSSTPRLPMSCCSMPCASTPAAGGSVCCSAAASTPRPCSPRWWTPART